MAAKSANESNHSRRLSLTRMMPFVTARIAPARAWADAAPRAPFRAAETVPCSTAPVTLARPTIKRSGRHRAAEAPAWARTLLDCFRSEGVRNLVFLPDTVMGRLLALAEEDPFFRLVGVHREEEAVGILSGLFMGGQRGAMLVQSSGLGNTLNALGSLAMAYCIPFPLLVSLRGELGEFNPAQLHMGRAVPECLDALTIQHITLRTIDGMKTIVSGALKTCYTADEPFGILLSAQLTGWKAEK
jgi:sulfopyruvate decarboxylase subunit alpha